MCSTPPHIRLPAVLSSPASATRRFSIRCWCCSMSSILLVQSFQSSLSGASSVPVLTGQVCHPETRVGVMIRQVNLEVQAVPGRTTRHKTLASTCRPLDRSLTTILLPVLWPFFPGLRVRLPLALRPHGDCGCLLPLDLPRPPPWGWSHLWRAERNMLSTHSTRQSVRQSVLIRTRSSRHRAHADDDRATGSAPPCPASDPSSWSC
jgi:hypothetical protein